MFHNYHEMILRTPGLLGYWPLDREYGARGLVKGNGGAVGGGLVVPTVAGPLDYQESEAPDFDGNDDLINTDLAWASGSYTLECFAHRDTVARSTMIGGSGAIPPLWRIDSDALPSDINWRPQAGQGTVTTWSAAWDRDTAWRYLALRVVLGTSAELLIDGVSLGEQANGSDLATPGNVQIGARTGSDPFNGRLAHVALTGRLLSTAEIISRVKAAR
jgi:hypothetical protein